MPKIQISCLSADLKAKLMPLLSPEEHRIIEEIETCDSGNIGTGKTGKKGRKLSAYQEHMSVCMKAGGDFKGCVGRWREKKGG